MISRVVRLAAAALAALVVAACSALSGISDAPPRSQHRSGLASPADVLAACLDQEVAGGGPVTSDDIASQVSQISARVEELRGLRFGDRAVAYELRSREEITRRFAAIVDDEFLPAEAEEDRRIYVALGAVPEDIDFRATIVGLVAGGIVGFYDPMTRQLVVAAAEEDAPLDPGEQAILAHELTHAVTDAMFGLPSDLIENGPGDAGLAALALVEGDAVLVERRFVRSVGPGPDEVAGEISLPTGVPHVLEAALRFPYEEGAAFACTLFSLGGTAALDAAYRDLPTTTAQILDPLRYLAREAGVDPRDLGALQAPWQRGAADAFGAADLLWLFEAPGDDASAALRDPLGSALDWAGGELQLWTDGPRSALGVALVDRGAGELCDAVADWYTAAFPDDKTIDTQSGEVMARDGATQDAVLRCGGAEVRLAIAPDLPTARALAA